MNISSNNNIILDKLFFSVWRNKYINFIIWGWVKNDYGENYERLFIKKRGYYQLNNIKLFNNYNALGVLKYKVYRGEYIHFPVNLKSNFFYETRSFSKEFFKMFIDNYRFQLLCQRNLFQNIIVGRNVNALNVFLNEPSTLTEKSLLNKSSDLEIPKWEFQRHKSQLSDIAINIGYIQILECLLENNEISVTHGQTLFNNLTFQIRKETSDDEKSILKVYNFCIENKFFKPQDFNGTIIKYDISWRVPKDYQSNIIFEIINNIKEFVEFDKTKSPLGLFISLNLYETSFKKAISILNIYNYIKDPTTINNQIHLPNGVENPNQEIKDCQNKSITIPLIKKFLEIISRDYKGQPLKSIELYYSYLIYTQQLELANELLISNNDNEKQYPIFEYSFHFCDLELLKLVRCENISLYITRSIFKMNPYSTFEEKINYLEYLVSDEHEKKLTVHNWYSLYYSLISSNQVELVQYLLNHHCKYFENPYSEFSIKRFSSEPLLIINSFESFKLIFKYLTMYSNEIFSSLLNSFLYNSNYFNTDNGNTDDFRFLNWFINEKYSSFGKYYIDRSNPMFMDNIQWDSPSFNDQKMKILKYLIENGFDCTYNGIFKKVINCKNFEYFKYLVENTNVSIDSSSTLLSGSQWYEAKYYLELICTTNNEKSFQYLERFPFSSHPIIPIDKLLGYYVKINDLDKILEKLKYLYSQMYMDKTDKDKSLINEHWSIIGSLIESSFNSFKLIMVELFNYFNPYHPDPFLRYFIPLIQWLINNQCIIGLEFIFENYQNVLKSLPINYHKDQLIKIAKEIHSIDLFDLFLNHSNLFPQPPTTESRFVEYNDVKSLETIITELPDDNPLLFFLYYRFPNLNFSIPYKKQDNEKETWKIDWFFKYILSKNTFCQINN